jgi:elongation factor P
MYETSDIRKGLKIMVDGAPFVVVDFQFVKPGKGAAFTRTKMKNLLTGGVIERNIRSGEKLEPADCEEREMQFLYKEDDRYVFMDNATYDQTAIGEEIVGDDKDFMPDNLTVSVLFYNARPVGITLPNFVELVVVQADPGHKGDTATGAQKSVVLSTGGKINAPLFISVGEKIRVDTRTREYMERVK